MQWPLLIRRVHGHSMVPILPPGTLVIAVRWIARLKAEQVVIAQREGKEIIKRISSLDETSVDLRGDHPETSTDSRHYGPLPRTSIIGRVVWPRTDKVLAESRAMRHRKGNSASRIHHR